MSDIFDRKDLIHSLTKELAKKLDLPAESSVYYTILGPLLCSNHYCFPIRQYCKFMFLLEHILITKILDRSTCSPPQIFLLFSTWSSFLAACLISSQGMHLFIHQTNIIENLLCARQCSVRFSKLSALSYSLSPG